MNVCEEAKNHWLAIKHARLDSQPFWGYEDVGAFFLLTASLSLVLRLLARMHFLSRAVIINPSVGLQSAVVVFLAAGLYSVLRFRYRRPVLKSLGWVVPQMIHVVTALIVGSSFAAGIAVYLRLRNEIIPPVPIVELLILGLVLGLSLEESLFRGCLLPILAHTTGTIPAVIVTALLFALFHGPQNLVHWVSFTETGVAYGWMRTASRSTTAAAITHATYNLVLFLLART
jgi:membrane protease YdiL (CAAX protease family)